MTNALSQPTPTTARRADWALAAWSVTAAFGTYFCMYGFRKPYTAAGFAGGTIWGLGEKPVLVGAQVLGYTASKVLGIRVIAEMPPARRAGGIIALVVAAEATLVLFGALPQPLHVGCLFLNGLALGLVYGLVVGFLEGRRTTEALTAGLCASFIVADGVTKSVGIALLGAGVSERWMPALAGLIFLPALLLFVGMLTRIPPPDAYDQAHRSVRPPMDRQDRTDLLRRYRTGLAAVMAAFVLVTIARSIRADFAPEIWRALGVSAVPATFANSELVVATGVLVACGLTVRIVDNRTAFLTSIGVSIAGALLMMVALAAVQRSAVGGFAFMVLLGLGLYLPYVAVHTTTFERLLATTRARGNLGFLMYVADSAGYLAYAALMVGQSVFPTPRGFLPFFTTTCWVIAVTTTACLALSGWYFAARFRAASPTPDRDPAHARP
jgi:hypothetical protein